MGFKSVTLSPLERDPTPFLEICRVFVWGLKPCLLGEERGERGIGTCR